MAWEYNKTNFALIANSTLIFTVFFISEMNKFQDKEEVQFSYINTLLCIRFRKSTPFFKDLAHFATD